ncbi:MAG: glycosyltransferase, partial [Candidatus Omnitrophica bacterium]|nr:glycosyltransferase [Candidatus Omnitrophota bacterium]
NIEPGFTFREYCENYAKNIGIHDRVFFIGERLDGPSILSSLFLHVLPSFNEGCPMVLLEAMARKVPNIASGIPPNKEIITDKKDGVFFEAGNSRQLSEAMLVFLNNPSLAQEIGLAGRINLEQNFTSEIMAARYESLFQSLARRIPSKENFG